MTHFSASKQRKGKTSLATLLLLTTALTTTAITVSAKNSGDMNMQESSVVEQSKMEHQGKRGHMFKKFKMMARALDLSEEQRQSIKDIFVQSKAEAETDKESMKQYREQMKSLTQEAVFNQEAFTQLYQSFEPTRANMALTKAKTRHAIAAVLTAEQKEKWESLAGKRGGRKGRFNQD